MRTLCSVAAAALIAASGAAATSTTTSVPASVPATLTIRIAKASFAHQYATVWSYLHPAYQKAVSRSAWQRCLRAYPTVPRGVKIKRISVANLQPAIPVVLPLLGKTRIVEVTLQLIFSAPGSGQLYGTEYGYWTRYKGKWVAVWLPATYGLHKAGKCDTAETRGLY